MIKIFHLVVYRLSSGLFVLISIDSGKVSFDFSRFKVSDLELEIKGTDGGSLSLSDTLKIEGTIKFSPPNVSSQIQYHSLIDGTLELTSGGLLDIDYNTNIGSNIKISGDSNIDVASEMTTIERKELESLLDPKNLIKPYF